MPEFKDAVTGSFCWIEVNTTDPKRAREFYTQLFGWEAIDMPSAGGADYTMFTLGGKHVAGLMQLPEQALKMGAPPHWLGYVGVESAEACAAKAKKLGGTVLAGPMDVGMGVMNVIADPAGAVFGAWQQKQSMGTFLYGGTGALCWNELMTANVDAAGKFYSELFAWKPEAMPMGDSTYTILKNGDAQAGGLMAKPKEMGDAPSMWGAYFSVKSADATADRAKQLGGQLLFPPMDIPGVGRFATLMDPVGAVFSVLQPAS